MANFMRGRVQIDGRCGCSWQYVEPGIELDREADMLAYVKGLVKRHAHERGHSPTVVVIREDFYSLDAPADPLEEVYSETS
jgi:hypothetical protein